VTILSTAVVIDDAADDDTVVNELAADDDTLDSDDENDDETADNDDENDDETDVIDAAADDETVVIDVAIDADNELVAELIDDETDDVVAALPPAILTTPVIDNVVPSHANFGAVDPPKLKVPVFRFSSEPSVVLKLFERILPVVIDAPSILVLPPVDVLDNND
jgi:hypothetical protein